MVILLYGPDTYRRSLKEHEYIGRYQAKYPNNTLEHFSFEDADGLGTFKIFIQAQSLFGSFKLGVVRDWSGLDAPVKKELVRLCKAAMDIKETTLLLIADKKPSADFSFLFKAPAINHEFPALAGEAFQKFLKEEAQKRGLQLDIASEYVLMQVYSGNSWGLINELEKLSLLNKKTVNKKTLEQHISEAAAVNVFTTINKIRDMQNVGARLGALEELLWQSEDPGMIFNILAVSPYATPLWKEKMADYDVAIKSGKLEYEEVLFDIALSSFK